MGPFHWNNRFHLTPNEMVNRIETLEDNSYFVYRLMISRTMEARRNCLYLKTQVGNYKNDTIRNVTKEWCG